MSKVGYIYISAKVIVEKNESSRDKFVLTQVSECKDTQKKYYNKIPSSSGIFLSHGAETIPIRQRLARRHEV